MSPPLPTAPDATALKALPASKLTVSPTLILTLPAFPFPEVLVDRYAPLVTDKELLAVIFTLPEFPCPKVPESKAAPLLSDREPAVMSMSPPFPIVLDPTEVKAPLEAPLLATPSKRTLSVAVILT